MGFSDRDMLVATQIAYYDFDIDILESNHYNATLRELFEQDPGIYEKLQANLNKKDNSPTEQYRAQEAMELYHEIMEEDSPYGDWVIKAVKDDNTGSGFYGCLIETSPEEAIIGFRGSESIDGNQVVKDWALADFGLLNSEQTWQQQVTEEFMREINENYNYEAYYTTGHSLGGNLSSHAAITAPEDMKEKILQSYSFDGPGFSEEYLSSHKEQIEDSEGKLTHYRWSIVGNLLTQPDGTKDKPVALKETSVENQWDYFLQRHDVSFVDFDGDGNVKKGATEIPEFLVSILTQVLDRGISIVPFFLAPRFPQIWGTLDILSYLLDIFNQQGKEQVTARMTGGKQGTSPQDLTGSKKFVIDSAGSREILARFENFEHQLLTIALETNELSQSLSSGCLQRELRQALNRNTRQIEELCKKLKIFREKGTEICQLYDSTEDRIIETYNKAEVY